MRDKLTATKARGVYRRERDGRLVVRVSSVDRKTGKLRERMEVQEPGRTLKEAERRAVELRGEASAATKIPTVVDYAESWTARKLARGDWTDGTGTSDASSGSLERYLLPRFGEWRIDKVTHGDLVRWIDWMMEKQYAANTIGNAKGIACEMFRAAAAEYGFPDPTPGLKTPRRPHRSGRNMAMMPGDVQRVIAWVEKEQPAWLPYVLLGFASGARMCETVVAEVRDLDLSGEIGRWTIARHLGKGRIVDGTKTTAKHKGGVASPTVYLDPGTTARLRELLKGRFPASRIAPPMEIPGRKRGEMGDGTSGREQVRTLFERISEGTGIDATSKAFRQTLATLGALAGVSAVVLGDQLGHSSAEITAIYQRAPVEARTAAARRLGELFGHKSGTDSGTSNARDGEVK